MTVPPLRPAMTDGEVRSFLADREGLTGSARRRFFEVLDRYGAFRQVGFRRTWSLLLPVSLFVSAICYAFDTPSRPRLDLLVWPGSFLLSIGPIWFVRRQEQRPLRIDGETEWRAYCLFLRPLIMAECPGFLDRNLALPPPPDSGVAGHPILLLRDQIKTRGLDYWWSALGGLWCGMLLLVLLHQLFLGPDQRLLLFLPLIGFLVGPLIGALGRTVVYFDTQRRAGDS